MPTFAPSVSVIILVAAWAVSSLMAGPAIAAGSETATTSPASVATYEQAKSAIAAGQFDQARDMLKGITAADPRNADAWNLYGFSARKSGDMKTAAKAYSKALKLNPAHLGALEYQGEMFLQLGEPDKAKANLAKLQGLCGTCEEMRDLEKAVQAAGV